MMAADIVFDNNMQRLLLLLLQDLDEEDDPLCNETSIDWPPHPLVEASLGLIMD